MQHDRRGNVLAQARMRDGVGRGFRDLRMTLERAVDLERSDLLAAPVDQLLAAAADGEKSLLVEAADVARSKPAVDEDRPVELGGVDVTGRHGRAAHQDNSLPVRGETAPTRAHD